MKSTETEDWKLDCFLQWKPKSKTVECSTCNGTGKTGGGFKSIDGAVVCSTCNGSRHVLVHPSGKPPKIPEDLTEYMRRAWWDFHHKGTSAK